MKHGTTPLVCALAGLAWPVVLLAGPPAAGKPPLPIESLKLDVVAMQNDLTNISAKMRIGLSKPIERGPEEPPATPAERCCERNIGRLNEKTLSIVRTVEQLRQHYHGRGEQRALDVTGTIFVELRTVSEGVALFRQAATEFQGQEVMHGIVRPFLRLREAIDELEACCPVTGETPGPWPPPPAR